MHRQYYETIRTNVEGLIELVSQMKTLPKDAIKGIGLYKTIINNTTDEKPIMILAHVLYKLKNRIKDRDNAFFAGEAFRSRICYIVNESGLVSEHDVEKVRSGLGGMCNFSNLTQLSKKKQIDFKAFIDNVVENYVPCINEYLEYKINIPIPHTILNT
jgi:hypothetical protein